jgi:DNA-binding XRE family transcriptional regulator
MLNKALREKRKTLGFTQQQMADAIDMEMQTYTKKERGLRRTTIQEGKRMARVLGCTVEDITPEEESR